jgi:catechol 2,3-dioxygenase-like lactoylglutathione lyase family enzyme
VWPILEFAVTPAAVTRIDRIALNVADLGGACAFYIGALGFTRMPDAAGAAVLRLGRQELELRVCSGRPYPQPRAANDPWFQHFAIAVSDMDRAYRRLTRFAQQPISEGGPQLLPPSTGSVTAYKFRDPDGHPLELSYIPGSVWLAQPRGPDDEPCLGIDHAALATDDPARSMAFYRDVLGFLPAGQGLNYGPGQDRLDGLEHVRLDIASLNAVEGGPHIELLHYRSPAPALARRPIGLHDIAATRLILRVADMPDIDGKLEAGGIDWRAAGDAKGRQLIQDPNGHWLELAGA